VELKKAQAEEAATEPRSDARQDPSRGKHHHLAASSNLPSPVALVALQAQH